MDKTIFYIVFPILIIVYSVMCYLAETKTKSFGIKNTLINSEKDIHSLKEYISDQMKRTLVAMPIGGGALLLYLAYMITGHFGNLEVWVVCSPFILIWVWSVRVKKLEKVVANIPASSEVLQNERNRLVKVWHTKLLPNFK